MAQYEVTTPMTASLKGYFEPKMHIGQDGRTFCGKDWAAAGWAFIEHRDTVPEDDGYYCARCLKRASQ